MVAEGSVMTVTGVGAQWVMGEQSTERGEGKGENRKDRGQKQESGVRESTSV